MSSFSNRGRIMLGLSAEYQQPFMRFVLCQNFESHFSWPVQEFLLWRGFMLRSCSNHAISCSDRPCTINSVSCFLLRCVAVFLWVFLIPQFLHRLWWAFHAFCCQNCSSYVGCFAAQGCSPHCSGCFIHCAFHGCFAHCKEVACIVLVLVSVLLFLLLFFFLLLLLLWWWWW